MDSLQYFDNLADLPDVKELPRELEATSESISIDGIPIAGRVFYTAYVCKNYYYKLAITYYSYNFMLCANLGSRQSLDCTADPCFEQHNLQIVPIQDCA